MKYLATFILPLLLASAANAAAEEIDLSGQWEFRYGDATAYQDSITLPGSMLTNGKGRDVGCSTKWTGSLYDQSYYYSDRYAPYRENGNIKFPFFLTPDKEYVGEAYYRRKVDIPADWASQRIMLHLERPHIETSVRINGKDAGHCMSLSTPHEFDISGLIEAGKSNEIEIMVYNGIENVCVGRDSHSVTDQTQGNWNGIVGDIRLESSPAKQFIRRVRVYPDVKNHIAEIKVLIGGNSAPRRGNVSAEVKTPDGIEISRIPVFYETGDTLIFKADLGEDMQLWDEFHTPLYTATVKLGEDIRTVEFGMRDIEVKGRDILINGEPVYIRGTVENCCFPLTGYPPTDEAPWDRIFAKCKEYGINMMRFHSYCPPEAAFAAADKAGIYLQPEGPSWPNHGVKLNSGMAIDSYLLEEAKAIIDTYGNHPSFVMMAAGNEPAGNWVPYTDRWVAAMKSYDHTRIYCGASVGGGWAWDGDSDYHVKGGGRGLDWNRRMPASMDDYKSDIEHPRNFNIDDPTRENHSPILAHEQGQWCAFPDLEETSRYTGPYKARNFEIFRDLLEKNGMKGMDRKFLMASGKLQALCYKYEIERNLRTPGYTGFQLLALNDYSGQGTATEGVLNVFWDEKGYIDSEEWREFCSEVVPLAKFPKFVFSSSEKANVEIEVMNASATELQSVPVAVSICDSKGLQITDTLISLSGIKKGKSNGIGVIDLPIDNAPAPEKYTLTVKIGSSGKNSWQYWVYPDEKVSSVSSDIFVCDTLGPNAIKVLERGGKVLLTAAGKITLGKDVEQHYLPVFWNTSWFKMRPPHTTGACIDSSHPLFNHGFPTDDWSNLNWWELLNRAQVMNLQELPADYQPPVQPIDTWHLSRKLGMIVEANVLNGQLLLTTFDIDSDLERRIVARRLRNAILDYMESSDFSPGITLDISTIEDFFTKETAPIEMYTNETPDELKPKLKKR